MYSVALCSLQTFQQSIKRSETTTRYEDKRGYTSCRLTTDACVLGTSRVSLLQRTTRKIGGIETYVQIY